MAFSSHGKYIFFVFLCGAGFPSAVRTETSQPRAGECSYYSVAKTIHCTGRTQLPTANPETVITGLYVTDSNIQDIPDDAFKNFPFAVEITVTNSKVESIQANAFRGLDSLRYLSFQGNSIQSLRSVSFPESLELLDVSDNTLDFSESFPFPESAPHLKTLYANNVGLTKIDNSQIQGMNSLDRLRIMRNSLSSLDLEDFQGLDHISSIDVEYNNVKEINGLPKGVELKSVKFLDAGNNQIASIDPDVFIGLPSLQELRLQDNPLVVPSNAPLLSHGSLAKVVLSRINGAALSSETFKTTPSLTSIEMIGSGITDITDAFIKLSSLRVVNLRNNSVVSVNANTFAVNAPLSTLILSFNPLEEFDVAAVKDVMESGSIDISNSPLACNIGYEDLVTWISETKSVTLYGSCDLWELPTICARNEDCIKGEHCCKDFECSVKGECSEGTTIASLPFIVVLYLALVTYWQKPSL